MAGLVARTDLFAHIFTMNAEILEKLIEYIDAAIEEKMDDMQSSDWGLISSIRKSELMEQLEELISEANSQAQPPDRVG